MNESKNERPIYLIIGHGRAAQHFGYYLNQLNIYHKTWHQSSKADLENLISHATHVLILISDDAIEDFYKSHPSLQNKVCIHFSGSVKINGLYGAHPLFTFGSQLYDLEIYKSIPFITDEGSPSFSSLFPQLSNPSGTIPAHKKALYHSYCAMSGNFTTILWQNIFKDFEKNLGLPSSLLLPYMTQIFSNLMTDPEKALTGPLIRRDKKTILSHLDALMGSAYQNLYYSFISFFEKVRPANKTRTPSFFGDI